MDGTRAALASRSEVARFQDKEFAASSEENPCEMTATQGFDGHRELMVKAVIGASGRSTPIRHENPTYGLPCVDIRHRS
jgi:hypothetical protein